MNRICRASIQLQSLAGLVCALSITLVPTIVAADEPIDFNRDVRGILSNKCFACHGPDEGKLEAGLRLDDATIATGTLESGSIAIVPGRPGESELVARITSSDKDVHMPPAHFGKPLTAGETATLQTWIQQGARYATHWSYVKPERPALPDIADAPPGWPRNPIDNFAFQTMSAHGLRPSPEADRYALARRAFLDLTGLPPTIEEVDTFVADQDPQAYEHLIDDLLQRPACGEHWARKWLDLARYADSAGYADDPPRTIWAYRDWVIRAINSNMPFDEFTIEQMAGDLLPDPTQDQLIATAFHRNTLTNNEGGTQDEEFRNVAVVDRVNTTMAVWMGTTMACAQCHSHKYDPLSQTEYFRLFAILNNTQDADRRDESPLVEIITDKQRQQRIDIEHRIQELDSIIATPTPELAAAQTAWESRLLVQPDWTTLKPAGVTRLADGPAMIQEDGTVLVETVAETDTYTIDLPVDTTAPRTIAAIRLEALPHESLPGKGSGHSGGNLVITGIKAQVVPAGDHAPIARFVRITNPGPNQILSLAEVEVFSAGANVARGGKATQHSTAFSGSPELAIDGNTDGDYQKKSVTHTETGTDPWWELDLGAAQPIERIGLWNRTDNGLHTRLKNFRMELLAADRGLVWEQTIAESPNPSVDASPTNIRPIEFRAAFADYNQANFEPGDVLKGTNGTNDGWAIGGSTTEPHGLVLAPKSPVIIDVPATLRITIEQNSPHKNHLLGCFRLSVTSGTTAIQRSQVPRAQLAVLDKPVADRSAEESAELARHYREHVAPQLKSERTELAGAHTTLTNMKPATSVPILREITDKRRETRLQHRGNYLDQGERVEPGLPAVFHSYPQDKPLDRLQLAHWLVDERNPLTARVVANRFWETLFGRGIVLTSEEFGSQGELPTHPELLDWLATELVAGGWNTKHVIRTIVTSATWRQSVRTTPTAVAADPDNRWLARGPRIRLSAEMVRDQALAVSGLLSHRMFGAPVNPPQPNLGLTAAFGSSTDWKTSEGEDRYRRGIYTTWRRSNPYPSMATFDAPNREVCTVRRNRTNTPLQSLVTLNDPVYVEAAQSLARRALAHAGSLDDRIVFAFRSCVLRPPHPAEVVPLVELFNDTRASLSGRDTEAMSLATDPLGPLPEGTSVTDAAAMTVVANVLLNLDEMFLKR